MPAFELRELTIADLPAAVDLASRLCDEGPVGELTTGPMRAGRRPRIERLGQQLLGNGVILGSFVDRQLVGVLGLCVMDHPVLGCRTALEAAFYIHPDHRRGVPGRRLLQAAVTWATDHECELLQVSAPARTKAGRYYTLEGFIEIETMYMLKL